MYVDGNLCMLTVIYTADSISIRITDGQQNMFLQSI